MVANPFFQLAFHSFSGEIRSHLVENRGINSACRLTHRPLLPTIAKRRSRMPKYKYSPDQSVITFPGPVTDGSEGWSADRDQPTSSMTRVAGPVVAAPPTTRRLLTYEVVLSGSYRKDIETLKRTYEEFRDLGCTILSPSSVSIVREEDGFVYMQGEETETPERIEDRHLEAIQKASFVWLHAP